MDNLKIINNEDLYELIYKVNSIPKKQFEDLLIDINSVYDDFNKLDMKQLYLFKSHAIGRLEKNKMYHINVVIFSIGVTLTGLILKPFFNESTITLGWLFAYILIAVSYFIALYLLLRDFFVIQKRIGYISMTIEIIDLVIKEKANKKENITSKKSNNL